MYIKYVTCTTGPTKHASMLKLNKQGFIRLQVPNSLMPSYLIQINMIGSPVSGDKQNIYGCSRSVSSTLYLLTEDWKWYLNKKATNLAVNFNATNVLKHSWILLKGINVIITLKFDIFTFLFLLNISVFLQLHSMLKDEYDFSANSTKF